MSAVFSSFRLFRFNAWISTNFVCCGMDRMFKIFSLMMREFEDIMFKDEKDFSK